jgi:hypothetical protein
MRRSSWLRAFLIAIAVMTVATTAAAQTAVAGQPSAALGISAGAAANGDGTQLTLGASAGWTLRSWVAAEARMSWFDRPAGDDALAASLSARLRLRTASGAIPFVKAGLGLHVGSFAGGPGTPEFFQRRLRNQSGQQTFRDPAFVAGAGVDVKASRRFAVRPEIESMIVWRDGRSYVVTSLSMQLSVLFEPHNITPARPINAR